MAVLVYLVLFLALTGHSSALYCICKDGVADTQLQKAIDYACGAGADCTPILQNGACFQPNTVKDHCNYAVNSYFQRKGQTNGSCNFTDTATTSANPPSNVASTCVYPSSSTSTTPTTGAPTTGTPTTGTGTTGLTPTTPFVGTGLGPTGSGTGIDNSGVASIEGITALFFASLTSGLFLLLWG